MAPPEISVANNPPRPLPVEPTGIATDLKPYAHWVVHLDKEPYDPKTGRRASTTDSRTWATFPEALKAFESGGWEGIGFVFSSGDPFIGIDLDNCRDPETGDLKEWAAKVCAAFVDAYKEVSPSGRGVHIIARGKAPNRKRVTIRKLAKALDVDPTTLLGE